MLKHAVGNRTHESAGLHLVEEINHRVVNEYTDVICTLSVAATHAADRNAREQLTSAANRVMAFARSHRALLPPKDRLLVDLGEYISGICERMLEASLGERGVRIELKTDDVSLSAMTCWRIGLIVSELVRNSSRHGFSGASGDILIDIARCEGELSCAVRDNGHAVMGDTGGRGRGLIDCIAAELGGSVDWDFTPDGTLAILHVPTAEPITH